MSVTNSNGSREKNIVYTHTSSPCGNILTIGESKWRMYGYLFYDYFNFSINLKFKIEKKKPWGLGSKNTGNNKI